MSNYLMYYYVSWSWINQHNKEFDFIGIDYFRFLSVKLSVYKSSKTRVPAIIFAVIIFGAGFEFCTHAKK